MTGKDVETLEATIRSTKMKERKKGREEEEKGFE